MKNKNHALVLLENGIHFSTIMNMTEKQIKVLAEKFDKEESKEAVSVSPSTGFKTTATAGDEFAIGDTIIKPKGPVEVISKEKPGVAPRTEGEMTEKFESKAQQGLFWARCNKSKGKEKEKWCDLAKEFSKSTTKKDYEKMPEKMHPEKTVKYKKKTTKENHEKELEDMIVEMLSNHINPKITKGDLKKSITEKSESMMLRKPKKVSMFSDEEGIEMKKMDKPIGKIFSIGKSPMEEQGTKEKERTKEREKTKTPTRKNPFKNPNPGVKEKPRGEQEKMKNDFIQWIKQALS